MIISTPASPLGLRNTQGMTFERYTSIPFRPICDGTRVPLTVEQFKALDWTTKYPGEFHPGIDVFHKISMTELQQVKAQLKPAGHLNLSAMARNRVVPKPLPASQPFFEYDPFVSRSIVGIHDHIETRLLVNLHYSYRLRTLLQDWSALQNWETGVINLLPDEHTLALVEREATTATEMAWQRVEIYANAEDLGLASWLWASKGIADRAQSGEMLGATGSVLFAYTPHWIATQKVLKDLCEHGDMGSLDTPTWFSGLHATCRKLGARHLVIYTGKYLAIGEFNDDSRHVSLSEPLAVACGDKYGEGVNWVTNKMLLPFSEMDICLGQVVIQLMASARATPSVAALDTNPQASSSSSQLPLATLPFPFTPTVLIPALGTSQPRPQFAIRFHDAKSRPAPYKKRQARTVFDFSKEGRLKLTPGSSEVLYDNLGPVPPPVSPVVWTAPHPDYDPRNVVIKLYRPGPNHIKRPFACVDDDFRPAISGRGGEPTRRIVHPNMARLVRSATVLDLPLPESFDAPQVGRLFDGPSPAKRQRIDSNGLGLQATDSFTFVHASPGPYPSAPSTAGPVFVTAAAKKRHADEIAAHKSKIARCRRTATSVNIATADTASTSASSCVLDPSVLAPSLTSNFLDTAAARNIKSTRDKKVAAIGHAGKMAKLRTTFDAIKRVGVSILSSVRYVLGAAPIQPVSDTSIDNNMAVESGMAGESGLNTGSDKGNTRRTAVC
ncbi:hypothetical protein FRB98_009190 [Tulasnella sp. 332]|nr:hypothetical protein FRB98_009190 [Tulasnella sp. 332]